MPQNIMLCIKPHGWTIGKTLFATSIKQSIETPLMPLSPNTSVPEVEVRAFMNLNPIEG